MEERIRETWAEYNLGHGYFFLAAEKRLHAPKRTPWGEKIISSDIGPCQLEWALGSMLIQYFQYVKAAVRMPGGIRWEVLRGGG